MQNLILLAVLAVIVILALVIICIFAYKIETESFEFSTTITKIFSLSVKIKSTNDWRKNQSANLGREGHQDYTQQHPSLAERHRQVGTVVVLETAEDRAKQGISV